MGVGRGGVCKVRFRLSQHLPEQKAMAQNFKSDGGKSIHFLKANLQKFEIKSIALPSKILARPMIGEICGDRVVLT